ncbi:MAG: hypothetical protein VW378_02855 [bacterium]
MSAGSTGGARRARRAGPSRRPEEGGATRGTAGIVTTNGTSRAFINAVPNLVDRVDTMEKSEILELFTSILEQSGCPLTSSPDFSDIDSTILKHYLKLGSSGLKKKYKQELSTLDSFLVTKFGKRVYELSDSRKEVMGIPSTSQQHSSSRRAGTASRRGGGSAMMDARRTPQFTGGYAPDSRSDLRYDRGASRRDGSAMRAAAAKGRNVDYRELNRIQTGEDLMLTLVGPILQLQQANGGSIVELSNSFMLVKTDEENVFQIQPSPADGNFLTIHVNIAQQTLEYGANRNGDRILNALTSDSSASGGGIMGGGAAASSSRQASVAQVQPSGDGSGAMRPAAAPSEGDDTTFLGLTRLSGEGYVINVQEGSQSVEIHTSETNGNPTLYTCLSRPSLTAAVLPEHYQPITFHDSDIISELQNSENSGAIFATASQFNSKEELSPQTASSSLEDYARDHSVGPISQLTCDQGVAQAIIDNGDGDVNPGGINSLKDLLPVLNEGKDSSKCFSLQNGYLHVPEGLTDSERVAVLDTLKTHIHLLRLPLSSDLVVSGHSHRVGMGYASAVPINYINDYGARLCNNGLQTAEGEQRQAYFNFVEAISQELIQEQYLQTLHQAYKQSQSSDDLSRVKAFLLPLGGGFFNNSHTTIMSAMLKAAAIMRANFPDFDTKVDMKCLTYHAYQEILSLQLVMDESLVQLQSGVSPEVESPEIPIAAPQAVPTLSQTPLQPELQACRQPIIDYLSQLGFTLDQHGYILHRPGASPSAQSLAEALEPEPEMDAATVFPPSGDDRLILEQALATLFFQTALNGDAGYAETIRTALAGLGLGSRQVQKGPPSFRLSQKPDSLNGSIFQSLDQAGVSLVPTLVKHPQFGEQLQLQVMCNSPQTLHAIGGTLYHSHKGGTYETGTFINADCTNQLLPFLSICLPDPLGDHYHPQSFVSGQKEKDTHLHALQPTFQSSTKTPTDRNSSCDLFTDAASYGYKLYRHMQLKVESHAHLKFTPDDADFTHKEGDKIMTPQQKLDYEERVARCINRYESGDMLVRCADTNEVKAFMSSDYRMNNPLLSTTLLPKQGSPLEVKLFTEYGEDTVGLVLDPHRCHADNFGQGYHCNAGTIGTTFHRQKTGAHHAQGVPTLNGQKKLLADLSARVEEGKSPHITPKRSDDGESWELPESDVRDGFPVGGRGGYGQASNEVLWNEQVLYRGIERDCCLGLFVKSDSDDFAQSLKSLVELQDRIRRKKGIYLPIFQLKPNNQIEELTPDALLCRLLGLEGQITPHEKPSALTLALQKAGIDMDRLPDLTRPSTETELLRLQLMLFNLKDINGNLSVTKEAQDHYGNSIFEFEKLRIIDNLHLVFPTPFQSESPTAHRTELYLNDQITTPDNAAFLRHCVRHNLSRFLGITYGAAGVSFDPKTLALFASEGPENFAKCVSRAMQSALCSGALTGEEIQAIVDSLRSANSPLARLGWDPRHFGMSPAGLDMILASKQICDINGSAIFGDPEQAEPQDLAGKNHDLFTRQLNYDTELNSIAQSDIQAALDDLNIGGKHILSCKLDDIKNLSCADQIKLVEILQKLQLACCFSTEDVPETTKSLQTILDLFPYNNHSQHSKLFKWLAIKKQCRPVSCEAPVVKAAEVGMAAPMGRGAMAVGRGAMAAPMGRGAMAAPMGRGAMAVGRRGMAAPMMAAAPLPLSLDERQGLNEKSLAILSAIPCIPDTYPAGSKQRETMEALGFCDAHGVPIYAKPPEFHEGNQGKPKSEYIDTRDLCGHQFELLSGPAYDPMRVLGDQLSVQVNNSSDSRDKFLANTLVVTTDGDAQVVRPNGLAYSRAVTPPPGGNIEFNGGNEKHDFQRTGKRRFYNDGGSTSYTGMGGYTKDDLQAVQKYDSTLLLSDQERRMKRATMVNTAYITATAKGGYGGSARIAFEQPVRALFVDATGIQFEKYGRGNFRDEDGHVYENELEAADFIIKAGAIENESPLFPAYYDEGKIPAYDTVDLLDLPTLDELSDPQHLHTDYIRLKDGSVFNRKAYNVACRQYMFTVMKAMKLQTSENPVYLKATLFGGGFFAKVGDQGFAGDLRQVVIETMLQDYIEMINSGTIVPGSVIEFPHYGNIDSLNPELIKSLKSSANTHGVKLVWTEQGDVLDLDLKTTVDGEQVDPKDFEKEGCFVLLNAGDAMSWKGNEPSSASVEAMIGNNSNLRIVMNVWANKLMLEPEQREQYAASEFLKLCQLEDPSYTALELVSFANSYNIDLSIIIEMAAKDPELNAAFTDKCQIEGLSAESSFKVVHFLKSCTSSMSEKALQKKAWHEQIRPIEIFTLTSHDGDFKNDFESKFGTDSAISVQSIIDCFKRLSTE